MPHGARIRVRAIPGSRQSGVVGRYAGGWKVRVRSAPERGKANDELVRLIASVLGLGVSNVMVVAGASSRDKVIEVVGAEQHIVDAAMESSACT